MDKFQMDEKTLDINLFTLEQPKVGPQTYLNVNYLPYFFNYLLQRLTRKERCSLLEFDLQTYILELCLYNLKYKGVKDLATGLIKEIRMAPRFWIPNSEAYADVQLRNEIFAIIHNKIITATPQVELTQEQQNEQDLELDRMKKLISVLDFDKLDFKSEVLKYPEVQTQIQKKHLPEDSSSKQVEAINKYIAQIQTQEKLKQEKFEFITEEQREINKQQGDQNKQKNLPNNVFDWISRYNAFDFSYQRETRQQAKSTVTNEQLSHRDIRKLIQEQQRIEMEDRRTIWVPNSIYKYQKIDIIILPYVYQFIFKPNIIFQKEHLRVQNLIMYLVMTDQEHSKTSKLKKNIMLSSDSDHKTSQRLFHTFLQQSNDKMMSDFNQFCLNQDICLAFYFSSTPATYRKELILLRNILFLAYTLAKTIRPQDVQYNFDSLDQIDPKQIINCLDDGDQLSKQQSPEDLIEDGGLANEDDVVQQTKKNIQSFQKWKNNQSHYFLLQVLQQLELYFAIPIDQYDELVKAYILNIEVIFASKQDHLTHYFKVGSHQGEEECMLAIKSYLTYIEAPQTQEKRSYIYHSSQRSEWDETQFKLFLDGLYKYFEIVVNNKRIARFMGENINPNHVRFVKGHYLRNLKKRGKQQNINRKELLKQDLDNFDISIFNFLKKKQKVEFVESQSLHDNQNKDKTELVDDQQKLLETTEQEKSHSQQVLERNKIEQ